MYQNSKQNNEGKHGSVLYCPRGFCHINVKLGELKLDHRIPLGSLHSMGLHSIHSIDIPLGALPPLMARAHAARFRLRSLMARFISRLRTARTAGTATKSVA